MRGLRSRLRGPFSSRDLGFELSLPEKDAPITGTSMGLGLAVAIAGVILGCRSEGVGVRPKSCYAWTGAVEPGGEVSPVDALALRAKVRAASFSGLKGIVVPHGMGDLARQEARTIDREFLVVEVKHLIDALGDPRLCESWQVASEIVALCHPRHRSVKRLVIQGLIPVLAAAILTGQAARTGLLRAVLGLGPPPSPEQISAELVEHCNGIRIAGPGFLRRHVIRPGGRVVFHQVVTNLDGDDRRLPRLVCIIGHNRRAGSPGGIIVYNLANGPPPDTVWSYTFTSSGLPPGLWTDVEDCFFTGKAGCIADLDGDQRLEIVVSSAYNPTAANFLWLLDGLREPRGVIYHPGHIEHLASLEVDGNDWPRLVAVGEHNPTGGISLLQLRWTDFLSFHAADTGGGRRSSFPTESCRQHVYYTRVNHSGRDRKLNASSDMISLDQFWRMSGRSRTILTSDSTLTAWGRITSYRDTAQVGWVALPLPGDTP